jgi:hypothetical protein
MRGHGPGLPIRCQHHVCGEHNLAIFFGRDINRASIYS